MLELEAGRSLFFPGPWHAWRLEKAARARPPAKTADRLGADIARLERFVERFRYKKSKAKQAQAKLTQIKRLERERTAARRGELELLTTRQKRRSASTSSSLPRSGRTVDRGRGPRRRCRRASELLHATSALALERGEHVGLVGPNGSGKTTLLETMLACASRSRARMRLGHGVVPAYFSQHEVELDERGSVLDCAQTATGLSAPAGAEPARPLPLLRLGGAREGGGQRSRAASVRRLALALVVASGANFLVLDEPTNHLDLESREALEAALDAFPGTVLLVSHDRALLDAVARRTARDRGRDAPLLRRRLG